MRFAGVPIPDSLTQNQTNAEASQELSASRSVQSPESRRPDASDGTEGHPNRPRGPPGGFDFAKSPALPSDICIEKRIQDNYTQSGMNSVHTEFYPGHFDQ